jgi:uncharacterized membrane protein YfcA
VVGGVLLLATPSTLFSRFVPWLVLFATVVFAWGSFAHRVPARARRLSPRATGVAQFLIAIYGGYFGGGIGFLMMAALTMAGIQTRTAIATKNVLAAMMNASAVALFVFSPHVRWAEALTLGAGAIAGGWAGAWALRRIDETWLRAGIVGLGLALTIGLFLRPI